MKIRTVQLNIAIAYLILSVYFFSNDITAFYLYCILTPIAGLFLYISIRENHLTLSLFSGAFFVAHAINPPFFFLYKNDYTHSGWTAVKDFNFEIYKFLQIYIWPYAIMLFILLFTLTLNRIFPIGKNKSFKFGVTDRNVNSNNDFIKGSKTKLYSILLWLFIILLAVPLNIFMFNNQIGILGLPQSRLPFKLTGTLYYFKYFIIPILIYYLYMKSNRSTVLALIVLIYGVLAGLAGVSRSISAFACSTVIFFSVKDRQPIRLLISTFIMIMAFEMITYQRDFVYSSEGLDFSDLILNVDWVSTVSWDLPFRILNAISGRLNGAQNIVLVYQCDLDDQINAILRFFSGQDIVENPALEFFGLNLPGDRAYGIGLGLISCLLLLSNKNILVLILLGFVIASFLYLSELVARNLQNLKDSFSLVSYPLIFLSTFLLNEPNLKRFYFFLIFLIIFLFLNNVYHSNKMKFIKSGLEEKSGL
jgi:hypothetical protein